MRYAICLLFLLTVHQCYPQKLNFKAGSNPVVVNAFQVIPSENWTLKGGWGYRIGADIDHKLSERWSFFHGIAISVNKLKYSHTGYSAVTGRYNFFEEGYQAWTFSVPIGLSRHYKVLSVPSEIRGFIEWNTGIGGNVRGYSTDFTSVGFFDRKIDFLNRETSNNGILKHNRFSLGFESKTRVTNHLSIDIAYSYSMSDVMFNYQIPGKRSKMHTLFAGINYELLKLNKKKTR